MHHMHDFLYATFIDATHLCFVTGLSCCPTVSSSFTAIRLHVRLQVLFTDNQALGNPCAISKNHPGKPMDFLKSQLSNLSYENLRVITIPETNLFAPENGWLEDKPFLLGYHLVRCYLSFRECTPQCHTFL